MKNYLALVLALLTFCTSPEVGYFQGDSFIKFYESGYGIDLIESQGGKFLFISETITIDADKETTLYQTDNDGNAEWVQKFNVGTIGYGYVGRDIQLYNGGSIIIGDGVDSLNAISMVVIVADDQGIPVSVIAPDFSSTGLGVISNATQSVRGYSAKLLGDLAYILCTFEDTAGRIGMMLLNVDLSSGAIIWYQTTVPEFTSPTVSRSLEWLSDGETLIWGTSEAESYTKLFTADVETQTIIETAFLPGYFYPDVVSKDAEVSLLVRDEGSVGSPDSARISYSEIAPTGVPVSSPSVIYSAAGGRPSGEFAEDNGLVVLAKFYHSSENSDFFIFKNQNQENHLWDHYYGGLGNELIGSLIVDSNGNNVLIGTSVQDRLPLITMIKTDDSGNIQ